MQTPHRFRSKRQLWTYSGLGMETRASAQYRFVRGQLQRAKKLAAAAQNVKRLVRFLSQPLTPIGEATT